MKKVYLIYVALFCVSLIFYGFSGNDSRYPTGAPAGYTGSPFDNKNCTHCHGGNLSTVQGWITSNVPETGWIAGETYDITLTVNSGGKKGFEISPQSFLGDLQGTLIAVSGTQLVGNNKYITHTSKVSATPAVWTFHWIAPEEGTGNVVFYGACAINESQTKLTSLLLPEDITASVQTEKETTINIYPNPASSAINLSYELTNTEDVTISLFNVNGRLIKNILSQNQAAGSHKISYNIDNKMSAGIYLVSIKYGTHSTVRKILVQ